MKFTDPGAQLALMMPVAPVNIDQPAGEDGDQTPPTWSPQYDRRHHYIWQGENRNLQYNSVVGEEGRMDHRVDATNVTQRQVVW